MIGSAMGSSQGSGRLARTKLAALQHGAGQQSKDLRPPLRQLKANGRYENRIGRPGQITSNCKESASGAQGQLGDAGCDADADLALQAEWLQRERIG